MDYIIYIFFQYFSTAISSITSVWVFNVSLGLNDDEINEGDHPYVEPNVVGDAEFVD